jgi:type I restriction enzyme S subunit
LKGNKDLLESYASGTTFPELSGRKAALIEFPLAPLSEQYRIVARIESLFAKLDEVKEKA